MLSGRGVRAFNSDGEITFTLTIGDASGLVGYNDAAGVGSTTAPDPPIARGIRVNQVGPSDVPAHDFAVSMYGPTNGEVPWRSDHLREILVDDADDVEQTFAMSDGDFSAPSTFGSWVWGDGTSKFWTAADDTETKSVTIRWGYRDV